MSLRLLIILLLSPFITLCQRYVGSVNIPNTVGDFFSTDMSNGSNFSRAGTDGTFTYASSGLTTSGTVVGSTINIIQYSLWQSNIEKNAYEITFVPTTDGSGIGVIHFGIIARVSLTGANKGELFLDQLNTSTAFTNLSNSGTTYFPITNGKTYTLTLRKEANAFYCIIKDVASGASQTIKYDLSYTVANFLGGSIGTGGMCWYGGTQTISKLREYTWVNKNSTAMFLGDSNMQGLGAINWYSRYFDLLQLYFKDQIENAGGSGNTSLDVVNELPEVLKVMPKCVVVNIGTNGITSANIDTIVNTCVRNGIYVYLITILPKPSPYGNNTNNSIIRAKIGTTGVTVIDNEAAMDSGYAYLAPGYSNPDSPIHMNIAGNYEFYQTLITPLSTMLKPR